MRRRLHRLCAAAAADSDRLCNPVGGAFGAAFTAPKRSGPVCVPTTRIWHHARVGSSASTRLERGGGGHGAFVHRLPTVNIVAAHPTGEACKNSTCH